MCVFRSAGKKVYFTLLASSFMFPISVFAQCVDNEDCVSLGYKETTNNENCLKCPFGEYWFCPGKTTEEEPTEPETAVLGQCTGYAKNCKIADILYSDGSCSADVISGKTPIGVVVYIGGDGCGQALALEGLGEYQWLTKYGILLDIPDLPNYNSYPINDFDSCENTKTVIDYSYKQCSNSASECYPAFWEVYNYTPSSMPETKGKWCLPSGGVLESISQNKAAIDQSLTRINKPNIGSSSWWWSSSESNSNKAWYWDASFGNFSDGYTSASKNYSFFVRPVIEF